MKLSEIIAVLEREKARLGDVEISVLSSDGRSTWVSRYNPEIEHHKPWPAKEEIYELRHKGW